MVDLRLVPSSTGRPSVVQSCEVVQHGQVLLGGLAEADARIDDRVLPGDAGGQRAVEAREQDRRCTSATTFDVARLLTVVHQDDGQSALASEAQQRLFGGHAPDVVEQVRAGVDALPAATPAASCRC